MAGKQKDARGWIFQIATNATGTAWADIEGLTGFEFDRGEGEETTETSTFEDRGQARSAVMQRGATCELTGRDLTDPDVAKKGASPVGQARINALAELVSDEATSLFRFRHVTRTDVWEQWPCWLSLGGSKGEINDKTEWTCTVTRDGAPTYPLVTA